MKSRQSLWLVKRSRWLILTGTRKWHLGQKDPRRHGLWTQSNEFIVVVDISKSIDLDCMLAKYLDFREAIFWYIYKQWKWSPHLSNLRVYMATSYQMFSLSLLDKPVKQVATIDRRNWMNRGAFQIRWEKSLIDFMWNAKRKLSPQIPVVCTWQMDDQDILPFCACICHYVAAEHFDIEWLHSSIKVNEPGEWRKTKSGQS